MRQRKPSLKKKLNSNLSEKLKENQRKLFVESRGGSTITINSEFGSLNRYHLTRREGECWRKGQAQDTRKERGRYKV